VEVLSRLIGHRFFPELWHVRTELTAVGPMGDNPVNEASELVRSVGVGGSL
jgi:tryptophan 2,3-dioxygenase